MPLSGSAAVAEVWPCLSLSPSSLKSIPPGLLGANHPLQFKHCRSDSLRECDLVVLAGVVMDFRLGYGMRIRGSTPILSINLDKTDLYKNRTPTLAILGDPAKVCSFSLLSALSSFAGVVAGGRGTPSPRPPECVGGLATSSASTGEGARG